MSLQGTEETSEASLITLNQTEPPVYNLQKMKNFFFFFLGFLSN